MSQRVTVHLTRASTMSRDHYNPSSQGPSGRYPPPPSSWPGPPPSPIIWGKGSWGKRSRLEGIQPHGFLGLWGLGDRNTASQGSSRSGAFLRLLSLRHGRPPPTKTIWYFPLCCVCKRHNVVVRFACAIACRGSCGKGLWNF